MSKRKIAIINQATVSFGDLSSIVQALQIQVNRDFAPAWQEDCDLVILSSKTDDYESLAILDNADQAGALGYHDLSQNGYPVGKVFVRVSVQAGEEVSTVISHELLEMLGNAHVDKIVKNPKNGYQYAVETADAVEAESYSINNIKVSNFVYPAWFNAQAPANAKLDHLGNCATPFKINPGGYMPVQVNGKWTQIFGSQEAFERYHRKDHSRSPRIIEEVEYSATGIPKSTRTYPKSLFDPAKYPIITR